MQINGSYSQVNIPVTLPPKKRKDFQTNGETSFPAENSAKKLKVESGQVSQMLHSSELNLKTIATFLSLDEEIVRGLQNGQEGKKILEFMLSKKKEHPENFVISEGTVRKIKAVFPGPEKEKLRKILMGMHQIAAFYKAFPINPTKTVRYPRSITGYPIPTLLTTDGKIFGIFKDSVIDKGAFKIIVDAVDLVDLEVFAYGKMKAINDAQYKDHIKEIKYMKQFNSNEFVRLFCFNSYLSKDKKEIKTGLLMEKCNGKNLLKSAKSDFFNRMPEHQQFSFLKSCLKSINLLHLEKVRHFDIKLENFLLQITDTFNPKLCDFGLSANLDEELSKFPGGTILNLSPEFVKAYDLYEEAIDIIKNGNEAIKNAEIELENIRVELESRDLSDREDKDLNDLRAREKELQKTVEDEKLKQKKGESQRLEAIKKSADLSSDIWAFGLCLYEMRTGAHPFKNIHIQSQLFGILRKLTENDIRGWFIPNVEEDPIAYLNFCLLNPNPKLRLTAKVALDKLEDLVTISNEIESYN